MNHQHINMYIIYKCIIMQWVNWWRLMSLNHPSINQLKTQRQIKWLCKYCTQHWEKGVVTVALLISQRMSTHQILKGFRGEQIDQPKTPRVWYKKHIHIIRNKGQWYSIADTPIYQSWEESPKSSQQTLSTHLIKTQHNQWNSLIALRAT